VAATAEFTLIADAGEAMAAIDGAGRVHPATGAPPETGRHAGGRGCRGRDEDFSSPPAQIRRALLTHRAPPSGFWRRNGDRAVGCSILIDGKKRSVMLVNFSQLMSARWLRRLSDLSQRHLTSLKYPTTGLGCFRKRHSSSDTL